MSSHIIIPPKKSPPAKSANEPTELAGKLAPDEAGAEVTEAGTKRIPVPKGTRVLIGGREFIAQSDEGIEIRGFTHAAHGQPTSVIIINAPTKEAAAFVSHLVAEGQMLSEDEVLWRRARNLPIDPSYTYDRRTGKQVGERDMKKRRDYHSEAELLEQWLAHLAVTDPRVAHTAEAIAEKKTKLLAERAESEAPRTAAQEEVEPETIELTTRGKIK